MSTVGAPGTDHHDQSVTYRTAEIAHMKDGKVTERWAFSDDTQRIIEFFGSMGGE